ncbi:LPS-assembly protein LptD [Pseudogemmobacter faecipullorum]|uniref:LPS-assembly protein LptD n=1 Tax=Pseudogemmobacter faecipullorum TaxID=2755041 RepID=A0ABS8CMJ5_9RHOB|nr:LPS assembly protein LptD [Pseudogemmobacter faecipullorum]MCB5410090.1 LPS-assembly protein LptD [Pseudogemmobacter faecipullorum]
MPLRRLLASLALSTAFILPLPGHAQEQAAMVTDELQVTSGDDRLVAQGHVEILYQGYRLTATSVTYDRSDDSLVIAGPLSLTSADGSTVILASQAELSADMTQGILTSARIVLDQQLQMAAGSLSRIGGRYSAMNNVVASSCQICAAHPTPLWEIRARRVIHDEAAQMIWFDQAQFRIGGVPVFYIPRLRLPDAKQSRVSGFLAPSMRSTSLLGTGLKLPYFLTLGDDRDLTITPYLSTKRSQTVELRYRQAFRTGAIELEGALTSDDLTDHSRRGWFRGRGSFELPDDFRLAFNVIATSDNAYLLDYGYSDRDRLDSRVELSRVRRNGFFSLRLVSFQSLRDEDDNDTLPSLVTDMTFHRRFSLGPLGGMGGLRIQTHSHLRTSASPLDPDAPLGDGISDGRDVSRLSARVDWRRSFISDLGLETTLLGEAQFDVYRLHQDAAFEGSYTRATAAAGVELRWPLLKASSNGVAHVLEPVIQIVGALDDKSGIPNEDSVLVEFDEASLWNLDRFPGADAIEQSSRANIGLSWTRYDPAGWSSILTIGKVLRKHDRDGFGLASGLGGLNSDWLAAASFNFASGFTATTRAVIGEDLELTKGEMRLSLSQGRLFLASSALWAVADPSENRYQDSRELTFDAAWKVNPSLTTKAEGRYDFDGKRGTIAGLGIEYRNECVVVDLSLSRRLTTSDSVNPTTNFGLSVDLIGFGNGKTAGPARRCY